jgi:hypothetical protein
MPSSIRPRREAGLRIQVAPTEVDLLDWPLVQQPLTTGASIAIVAIAATVVGLVSHPGLGVLAAFCLLLTIWRLLIPRHYHFGGAGITERIFRFHRIIPWAAVGDCRVHPRGVLILPNVAATPLIALCGLFIQTGSRQDEVLANLEYYLYGWSSRMSNQSAARDTGPHNPALSPDRLVE